MKTNTTTTICTDSRRTYMAPLIECYHLEQQVALMENTTWEHNDDNEIPPGGFLAPSNPGDFWGNSSDEEEEEDMY